MAIKRRYLQEKKARTSVSIRKDGKRIVSQTRVVPGYIARKSELFRLARSVFIHHVPVGFRRRPDLFRQFVPKLQQIAREGGEAYEGALMALKFAFRPFNPEDFNSKGRGPRYIEEVHKTPKGDYKVTSYKAHLWYDEKSYEEAVALLS